MSRGTIIDFMIFEELLHCQNLSDHHILVGVGDFGVGQLNRRQHMPIFGLSGPMSTEVDGVVLGAPTAARVAIHGSSTSCYWQMCNCARHIKTVPRHRSGGAVLVAKPSEIGYHPTVKTIQHSDIRLPPWSNCVTTFIEWGLKTSG
jgi:hypothetical protein